MSDLRKKGRLVDPSFIDKEALSVTGGGTIHVSDEVVINGIRIGDDLYEADEQDREKAIEYFLKQLLQ